MNEGLARLHAIDVAAVGLADYGKPGSYFARQLQRWTEQYRAERNGKNRRHGPPDRLARAKCPARRRPRRAGPRRLAHRQHDLRPPMRRVCLRSWTGSSRRSAIPSPTSPISACTGACPTPARTASAASIARRKGIPTEANMSPPIAGGRASTAFPTGPSSSHSACSATPRSRKGSTSARSTATPRIRSARGKMRDRGAADVTARDGRDRSRRLRRSPGADLGRRERKRLAARSPPC